MSDKLEKFIIRWFDPSKSPGTLNELLTQAEDGVDWEWLAAEVKNLPDEQFFGTPYWRCLRDGVKERDNYACQKCGAKPGADFLVVHYKTSQHLGLEHRHLHELLTLCSVCYLERQGRLIEAVVAKARMARAIKESALSPLDRLDLDMIGASGPVMRQQHKTL